MRAPKLTTELSYEETCNALDHKDPYLKSFNGNLLTLHGLKILDLFLTFTIYKIKQQINVS